MNRTGTWRMLAAGVAVAALAGTGARGEETYWLNASQPIDGTDPVEIALTNSAGTAFSVTRTGDGSSTNQWTFDFSTLTTPSEINFGTNSLYCARTDALSRNSFVFNFADAAILGEAKSGIITRRSGTDSERAADHVVFTNVGAISMEGIDTRARLTSWVTGSGYRRSGSITIGQAESRAGPISMYFIRSDVWDSHRNHRVQSDEITIYGTGDVLLAEDLMAYSGARSGPNITVNHYGNFSVRDIDNSTWGHDVTPSRGGDITLDGNDGSGDATVRDIKAWISMGSYGAGSQHTIHIQNYTDVTIRDIIAYGCASRYAANVLIENISGDIAIAGAINLEAVDNAAMVGNMQLSCGGTITLAGLDLDRMLYAALDSGRGTSLIDGPLDNFDTGHTGGTGSTADPFVTTQIVLRASSGQKIYYKVKGGENAYLGGHAYRIADPDGNAGQGGILMAKPARGTVILFF